MKKTELDEPAAAAAAAAFAAQLGVISIFLLLSYCNIFNILSYREVVASRLLACVYNAAIYHHPVRTPTEPLHLSIEIFAPAH